MSGSRNAKLPAMNAFILLGSNSSPMPTLKVPEIIVTFSRCGCQWGAIRNPSGIFKRIVKSPVEAVGSPSSTANCAPGRTTGGAAPQEIVSGVTAFFSCELPCAALVNASPAQENIPAAARVRNKYRFIVEPPSFVVRRSVSNCGNHVLGGGLFQ